MSVQSPRGKLSSDEGSAHPKLALRQSPRQKRAARFVLVIVLSLLAAWLARDFLAPIGWAVVVAIATWPLYLRFAARFREPTPVPFLLAFIGIFGGLQTFGLLGLFVGPVIMVALLTVWQEWPGSEAT